MGGIPLSAAGGAKPVENGLPAVDLKAVLLQEMLKEVGGGVTVQMLDAAAADAFFVEMVVAITAPSHVLKDVAPGLLIAEFSYGLCLAQLGQAAVDAAFSAFGVPVQGKAELIHAELTVGMLREEPKQRGAPLGIVVFTVCHGVSFASI